jgi:hypothetical protein
MAKLFHGWAGVLKATIRNAQITLRLR